jgi:hypothetical protein
VLEEVAERHIKMAVKQKENPLLFNSHIAVPRHILAMIFTWSQFGHHIIASYQTLVSILFTDLF